MSLSSWTRLFFGYSFNETHQTSESEFIQKRSFFFSLSVLSAAWLWNLGFFRIPNYVLSCSTNKKQLLMCLHSSTNKRQLLMCLTLRRINGNCLVSVVWRFTPCWLFFYPLVSIMITGLLLSADAYMAYREWDFLLPMSACTNREAWRETASLSIANFWLLL